jgi:hypothetical protein
MTLVGRASCNICKGRIIEAISWSVSLLDGAGFKQGGSDQSANFALFVVLSNGHAVYGLVCKQLYKESTMTNRRLPTLVGLVVVLLLIATTVVFAASRNFRTHLNGSFEVPVRDTRAQGQAIFQLNQDGTALEYKLNVANIENVLQAHIHMGPPTGTGGIVAWLYPSGPPAQLIPGRFNGTLGEGTITADNLVGDLAGQPLDALIEQMEAGNAYVNVHTTQFPPGEIRGNLP